MILTFDAFVADGLGPHLPQSVDFEWPAGSDVTLRGTLRHSDGNLYPIGLGMAVLMGWKASDKDTVPLVQRQATVISGAVFEVYIGAGDVQHGLGPGRFVCDALLGITIGQVTDYEEVLKPSRTNITRTITQAGGTVSVPTFQAPLGQGPPGIPGPAPAGGADGMFIRRVAGVPAWVTLTQDMIAAPLTPTLVGPQLVKEFGDVLVNPQFTAGFNINPDTAELQDDSDTQAIPVPTTTALGYGAPASIFAPRTYVSPDPITPYHTWTYRITAGGITKSVSIKVFWEARAYWGVAVEPGVVNQAFITGLSNNTLEPGFAESFAFLAGGGTKKLFLCLATGWGQPNAFHDLVTGLPVPMVRVAHLVDVVNAFGVHVPTDVWESAQFYTQPITLVVT